MEEQFRYRRFPAIPRKISEIDPKTDIRVRILGKFIDNVDGIVVIDDGSGKAEIVFEGNVNIKQGDLIRIFTRVIPLEEGYELRGEVLQDMKGIDIEMYKKIYGL